MLLAAKRRMILGLKLVIFRLVIHALIKYLLWCTIPVMRLRMTLLTFGLSAKEKATHGTQMLEIRGICLGADIPLGYYSAQKKILLGGNSTLRMHQTTPYTTTGGYGCMTTYQKIRILSQVTGDSGVCC